MADKEDGGGTVAALDHRREMAADMTRTYLCYAERYKTTASRFSGGMMSSRVPFSEWIVAARAIVDTQAQVMVDADGVVRCVVPSDMYSPDIVELADFFCLIDDHVTAIPQPDSEGKTDG